MSIISADNDLYHEQKLVKNWAASYAKRECDSVRDELAAHIAEPVLEHIDGSVISSKLAADSVTTEKIANAAVTEEKIADYSITVDKVSDELMETIDMALNTAETANLNANTAIETADEAKETANKTAEKLNAGTVYTTAPKRVGTWIDGTPIWRISFLHEILGLNETYWDITEYVIRDISAAKVINEYARIEAYEIPAGYYYNPISLQMGPGGDNGSSSSWYYIADYFSRYNNIYGWIEIITPESNLVAKVVE